jgi:hypothetical protein
MTSAEKPKTNIGRVAYALAHAYGSKLATVRNGVALTNASVAGYGSRPDSPKRYADQHWKEFRYLARAANEAMRSPDGSMKRAAALHLAKEPGNITEADLEMTERIWVTMANRALIDADEDAISAVLNVTS